MLMAVHCYNLLKVKTQLQGLIFRAYRHGRAWRSEIRAWKFGNPCSKFWQCFIIAVAPDFIFQGQMHQIRFRLELRPRPRRGAQSAPTDPGQLDIRSPTYKGREGRNGEGKREGRGRDGLLQTLYLDLRGPTPKWREWRERDRRGEGRGKEGRVCAWTFFRNISSCLTRFKTSNAACLCRYSAVNTFYSIVTMKDDLLTPVSDTFICVPKCIVASENLFITLQDVMFPAFFMKINLTLSRCHVITQE